MEDILLLFIIRKANTFPKQSVSELYNMLLRNATFLCLLAGLMLARPGACAGTGMKKVQTILSDDDWIMLSTSPKCNICATTNHGEDSPPGSPVVVDRCKNWDAEEGWRISTDPSDGEAFVVMLGNENGEKMLVLSA
jgi:hypothetical protein